MRTTIAIADELLEHAKQQGRRRGQTLGQVVEGALRRELAASAGSSGRPPVPAFDGGSGPRPGIDLASNRALHEALDDQQPLDGHH